MQIDRADQAAHYYPDFQVDLADQVIQVDREVLVDMLELLVAHIDTMVEEPAFYDVQKY